MIEILINTIKHTNGAMAITQLFVHLNQREIDAKKKDCLQMPNHNQIYTRLWANYSTKYW